MGMADWRTIDLGEPLTGDEVEVLVARRIAAWPPLRRHQFEAEGGTVVLHPDVLYDVLNVERHREGCKEPGHVHPGGYRSHWTDSFEDGRPVIRLRAWRVDSDTALRYDEVRLRREEVLTREQTQGTH